jgi:hypothetical protein
MRPGCDRSAVARLTFDPVGCELWLDALANHTAPVQELCTFHVDRLTVPRGWTVIDRRPGVVVAAPEPASAPAPVPAPAPEPAPAEVGQPESAAEPAEQAPAVPSFEPDERDQSDGVDETDGVEARPPARRERKPATPLLERAFAWTGPQQSILTQPRRHDDGD